MSLNMNRNKLPLVMMLAAGAAAAIIFFTMDFDLKDWLLSLLIVLVVFYTLGSILKWLLNRFDKENAKKALEEGEVIEKEAEAEKKEEGESEKEEKEDSKE